jgi:hypothetical protein
MLAELVCLAVSLQFGVNVFHLMQALFDQEIENCSNTTVWFVMLHRPHCPACVAASADLNVASTEAAGMVRFGEIDVSVNPAVVRRYPIFSVPKFLIFHPRGHTQFLLRRSAANFLNDATWHIPQLETEIDESLTGKAAVLLTAMVPVPPLWAAISCAFADQPVRIGFSANDTLIKKFAVTSLPAIVFVDNDEARRYEGPINFWSIRNAIKTFIGEEDGPVPPLDDFETDCSGSFCVIGPASGEFQDMAAEFGGRPFKFFVCGEYCPDWAAVASWIIKEKTMAIKCDSLGELREGIHAVVGGMADWQLFELLKNREDL